MIKLASSTNVKADSVATEGDNHGSYDVVIANAAEERKDVGTLTEVCSSSELDEVEVLTLVHEQIPQYRLRADTITDFAGYPHSDFALTTAGPVVDLDEPVDLSPELIGETLKYFAASSSLSLSLSPSSSSSSPSSRSMHPSGMGDLVLDPYAVLCAERVNQMTKTYNDIEAVSRLLEEKERDLELAARIGQTLLSKNKELTARNDCLDDQLTQANERANQLRHDLSIKEELLRFFNEDLENEVAEPNADVEPAEESLVNKDFLNKKLENLETENLTLRLETANLKTATACYEEKEKQLMEDCITQLAEVNCQVETFAEELQRKAEENEGQREQIAKFCTQAAGLQVKIRKLTVDNMELHEKLTTSTDSHRKLTKEFGGMQDKYDELYEMLEEAQVELQILRHSKQRGGGRSTKTDHYHSDDVDVDDDDHEGADDLSLASELEMSLQQELNLSSRRAQSWKIFETARAAKRAMAKVANRQSVSSVNSSTCSAPAALLPHQQQALGVVGFDQESSCQSLTSRTMSIYTSDGGGDDSLHSDGYSADMDSLYGSNQELGRPGIPGSNDLESALRRLALRKENEEEERRRSGRSRLGMASGGMSPAPSTPRGYSPGEGMLTPSSAYSSLAPSGGGSSGGGGAAFRASNKLKIMKPMEGSVTLRQWQQLATPHLGGIFEKRERVRMKGSHKGGQGQGQGRDGDSVDDDEGDNFQEASGMERTDISGSTSSLMTDGSGSGGGGGGVHRSPSPHTRADWMDFNDPRTPSPGMPFLSQHNNSYRPMQTSTPISSTTTSMASNNNPTSTSTTSSPLSMGLAALLDGPSGGRGSMMRAAVPLSRKAASNSNSNIQKSNNFLTAALTSLSASTPSLPTEDVTTGSGRFMLPSMHAQSIAGIQQMASNQSSPPSIAYPSSSSLSSSSTSSMSSNKFSSPGILSRYRNLPGSRSLEEVAVDPHDPVSTSASSAMRPPAPTSIQSSPSHSSSTTTTTASSLSSTSATGASKNSWVFSPEMTGQGFIQQLKSRGYSLYGLWANATTVAAATTASYTLPLSVSASSSTAAAGGGGDATTSVNRLSNMMMAKGFASSPSPSSPSSTVDGDGSRNIGLPGLSYFMPDSRPSTVSSPIDLDPDNSFTTTATTTAISSTTASSGPGLARGGGGDAGSGSGGGGGVFGTYANFRRSGHL